MKKNKLITFIIFLGILSSLDLHAEKAQVPCLKKDGGIGLQGLDKYDCQLARGIVKDPKIKNEFENKVNDKLAEKLSVKASERLEEITILDRYFDQIGLDFGKTENRVTRKCKLEVIASPICSPGKTPSSFQQKLKFLSSKFPSSENSIKSGKSESLFEKMRNRSNQIRGASQVSVNQCPVSGKTGHFFLESQFSDNAAEKFLEDLNNNKSDRVNAFYDAYPQFKMLKQNAGKDGSAFLKHFESEMKKYSPKDGSQKKFMEKFFFSERTQQQLTDALADKCEAIASDIKDYACKEMDHLGMTQDNAADLFEDDDNSEVDLQIAKGFSCNYKTESDEEDVAALLKGESPGARIEQFKSDRRVPKPLEVSISVDPFCKMYTCSDEKVKVMSSCQKGGPLNSDDLAKVCGDKCDLGMQRYIAFMKSLEKDIELTQGSSMSVAASDGEVKKPRGYSSFYQNFLGVEGTLIAEGKSVTPMTIAEKKAEFAERKLDLTPQTASLTQQPKEFAKIDRDDSFSRVEKPDFVSSPAPERDNDQFRRSFNAAQFAKASAETPLASNKSKKMVFDEGDSARMDEMKKLRGELADAISKVKGTDEERLAAVADNNAVAITPKGSTKDTTRNLNQGEKDRLDSYRDSLNNWEGRLRNWQGQLSDREVRGNSGIVTGAVDPRAAGNGIDQSNTTGANANNIKLTKTISGAAGAAGAKAEAGERAPGAEKADAEAGVVNSENLATLQKDSLKKLGIVASDSFIIKVRFQDKIYSIPVKTFNHDGKSMYVPLLNDKNRELSKIVYESPLFADYRNYQIERQYKLEKK